MEALAVSTGFNAEGGGKQFNFSTRSTHSELHGVLRVARAARREKDGFFLRAESFYNVASEVETLAQEGDSERFLARYGGRSPHHQSHGESFLALVTNRFAGAGFYLLDEPEAALSPARQLALLKLIHHQVEVLGSQFVIATHSPIVMAYPGATIYHLDTSGIAPIAYEETEHFRISRDFLVNRSSYLHHLLADE